MDNFFLFIILGQLILNRARRKTLICCRLRTTLGLDSQLQLKRLFTVHTACKASNYVQWKLYCRIRICLADVWFIIQFSIGKAHFVSLCVCGRKAASSWFPPLALPSRITVLVLVQTTLVLAVDTAYQLLMWQFLLSRASFKVSRSYC